VPTPGDGVCSGGETREHPLGTRRHLASSAPFASLFTLLLAL